ncbi:hypothetical protein scyTo_0011679, partial [Scyliorhinus torazame]|nr:hypothetical protein [Scyliorhinus torazame]
CACSGPPPSDLLPPAAPEGSSPPFPFRSGQTDALPAWRACCLGESEARIKGLRHAAGVRAMTRHGKNCTAGAVYTYYEKKKDTAVSGYGTQSLRLSKDAIKDFDCCCLSLQPCKDPVITPDGFIYEKEAILEYILHQKTEIAKKIKAYEKQKNIKKTELAELAKAEKESKVKAFLEKESTIVSKPLNPFSSKEGEAQASSSTEPVQHGGEKHLPSFWIPSLTPEAKASTVRKPGGTGFAGSGVKLEAKESRPVMQA